MSFLDDLRVELRRAGIRGKTCRRIELELADHLACDPSAEERVGSPRELAERFAAELCPVRTRRVAWRSFYALALTAGLLAVYGRSMSPAGGLPEVAGGRYVVVVVSTLGLVICAQVAFVAGVLALRRRPDDPRQAALVQRRVTVALIAGAGVAVAELAQAAAVGSLRPAWWLVFALLAGCASLLVLVPCVVLLREAVAVTRPGAGGAGGFAADLPGPLREHAGAVSVAIGAGAVLLVGVGSALAERSALEGLTRGAVEGVAFAGCYLLLRARLGLTTGESSPVV